nr:isoprenylcysteine carboxylmethyltransferase family protein [Candidatus Njordarchaeum guaymaensis]
MSYQLWDLIWFVISAVSMWLMLPIHFRSVEHQKLETERGKDKGKRIGARYGVISGWGFFIFLFAIWLSPQPRFTIPFLEGHSIVIPLIDFSIPLTNLLIFLPFLVVGAWFGIAGVKATGLAVAETHRSEKVVSTGVYGVMRHPQYFGAIMTHVGFSILMSALYSLIYTPFVILYNFLVARKEEKELIREFGKQYEDYRKRVPMLRPKT